MMKAVLFYFCMISAALAQPYPYQGCYHDAAETSGGSDATRSLPVRLMSSGATVESCAQAAGANYPFFGVQHGGECFAGFTPGNVAMASDCNVPCTANANEMCGGSWRNSIYTAQVCPAGSYMTSLMPFVCTPVETMCPSNLVLGAACHANDSCFSISRPDATSATVTKKYCDGNWVGTAPEKGIVK